MLLAGSLAIHHGLPSHGNLIKNECVALNVHLYLKLFCNQLQQTQREGTLAFNPTAVCTEATVSKRGTA
jgi:hypothetical protein